MSLRIEVKRHPRPEQFDPDEYADHVWQLVQPTFDTWLADPRNVPGFDVEVEVGDVRAQFARDALLQLRPGVMQIDVLD